MSNQLQQLTDFLKRCDFQRNTSLKIVTIIILASIVYSFYDTNCIPAVCFIRVIHFSVILFVITGPFIINDKPLLSLYILIVAFIVFHWLLSNDSCVLTLVEQKITGRKSNDTFIGKIVKPIYNVSNSQISYSTFLLLILAILKYFYKYGFTFTLS